MIVVLLAAACGKYSEAEVQRLESSAETENVRRHDTALADALRAHDLVESAAPPAATDTSDADVLVIPSGCSGNTCSCDRDTEYHWATDRAGATYLVRLHTEWRVRTVHQQGACGFGCGVPAPAEPAQLYALPARWGGFVDATVVRESVNVMCDRMIPAP